MTPVLLVNSAVSLIVGAALLFVWQRDAAQRFCRDLGAAFLVQSMAPPVFLLWRAGPPPWNDLGAALLVCAAIHVPPLQRLFSTPIAKFYGRISYSLYLFHFAILWIVEFGVFGRPHSIGAACVVFATTLAIATGAAELGWRFVEAPAIRAGRAVTRAGEAFARRVWS